MRCLLRSCSLALTAVLTISMFTACASKPIDPTAQIPVAPLSNLTVEAEQVQANAEVVAEVMKLWGAIKYLNIERPNNIDAYLLELINLRLNDPDAYWQNVNQLFIDLYIGLQANLPIPTALNWLTSDSNKDQSRSENHVALAACLPTECEQKEHLTQQILTAHAAFGLGDEYVNWLPIPEPINEANYASDSLATRLIIAARIWSTLNYLSPYRDYAFAGGSNTGQHEDASFEDVLAQVLASNWLYNESNFEYELVNYIGGAMNDGHIMGGGSQPYCSYPFSTAWLENELYIVGERAEGTFGQLGLTSGQIISHINGKATADFLAQRTTPASNLAKRQWLNSSRKFNVVNCEQNMTITVDSMQLELKPLPADELAVWFSTLPQSQAENQINAQPIQLPDSIGYINFAGGPLSAEAWQTLLGKPAIIIDNRRYPQLETIEQAYHHLLWDQSFGKPHTLNLYRPSQTGFGEQELMEQLDTRQFEQGQSYPNRAYQGKLYMLVNRHTKSMGETVALAFAEYSDVTIIGEQTAGANGDVRRLPLSRGEIMTYSALGAYFLNGELHQMVGVPIDVEVSLSAEDYFQGMGLRINLQSN